VTVRRASRLHGPAPLAMMKTIVPMRATPGLWARKPRGYHEGLRVWIGQFCAVREEQAESGMLSCDGIRIQEER